LSAFPMLSPVSRGDRESHRDARIKQPLEAGDALAGMIRCVVVDEEEER
jgi:hypothetical protein